MQNLYAFDLTDITTKWLRKLRKNNYNKKSDSYCMKKRAIQGKARVVKSRKIMKKNIPFNLFRSKNKIVIPENIDVLLLLVVSHRF